MARGCWGWRSLGLSCARGGHGLGRCSSVNHCGRSEEARGCPSVLSTLDLDALENATALTCRTAKGCYQEEERSLGVRAKRTFE